MKKIFALLIVLSALFACSKLEETNTASEPREDGTWLVTASANIPLTKLSYSENDDVNKNAGLKSVWETGDKFYAIQKTGEETAVVTFTLTDGDGTSKAKFQASTTIEPTAETTWKAVLGGAATTGEAEINCSYKNQTGQIGDLDNFNYISATGTGTAPAFSFDPGTALTYVMRVKLPAGIKCIEYTPSAFWKITTSTDKAQYYNPSEFGWDDADYNYAAFELKNTSTITLASASTAGQIIYIAVPALNYDYNLKSDWAGSGTIYGNCRNGVIVTLLNNVSDEATQSNGAVLGSDISSKGGKIGTFDMSSMALISRPKPSDAITLTNSGELLVGANYSSSNYYKDNLFQSATRLVTKWAPYDLGASSVGTNGTRFAFGEINSRESFIKGTNAHYGHNTGFYDVIACKYALNTCATQIYSQALETIKTKPCFSIAGSRYDAARVKWGSAWRMPHDIEIEYMLAAPASSSSDASVTLTADGGASIVIPLQAHSSFYSDKPRAYSGGDNASNYALYWGADQAQRSGTTTGNTDKAYMYCIWTRSGTKKHDYYQDGSRWAGYLIRPVLASSEWHID